MRTLSSEHVRQIHVHLTQYFAKSTDPISPPGIRSEQLLESAVHKQHAGYGDFRKYDTPTLNAAALIYGICSNHPFHNGNKRTALLAGIMHLDLNGLALVGVNREQLYSLMLRVADHKLVGAHVGGSPKLHRRPTQEQEITAINEWLRTKTRKIVRGERSITFSELYRIINAFGDFQIGTRKKDNYIEVLRRRRSLLRGETWKVAYKLPCPGDSRIVSVDEIKRLRRALELDELHGVDSQSFYDTQSVIDTFIREHRQVLRRLAKT